MDFICGVRSGGSFLCKELPQHVLAAVGNLGIWMTYRLQRRRGAAAATATTAAVTAAAAAAAAATATMFQIQTGWQQPWRMAAALSDCPGPARAMELGKVSGYWRTRAYGPGTPQLLLLLLLLLLQLQPK